MLRTAVMVGLLTTAAPVAAQRATSVAVRPSGTATFAGLPSLVEQELAGLIGVRVAPAARAAFHLRPSITRLVHEGRGGTRMVRCVIAVIVEDRHGAIRLVLSGSARAAGIHERDELERLAISGAIRSALRPLAHALLAGAAK